GGGGGGEQRGMFLLIFFCRRGGELVECGNVFMAKPPLFKLKRGKSEQYIKDERQMGKFLLRKATENLHIEIEKTSKTIDGRELTNFLEKLIELNNVFVRVDRHLRDPRVVDLLLGMVADGRTF